MSAQTTPEAAPWWQFGHVWLVVAGPLVVVMASFFILRNELSTCFFHQRAHRLSLLVLDDSYFLEVTRFRE